MSDSGDAARDYAGLVFAEMEKAKAEIERLKELYYEAKAQRDELQERFDKARGMHRLDVDNPLYEGLCLEFLEPGVLAATVRHLKSERDEARNVLKDLRDYILEEGRAYPWLKEEG